MDFCITSVEAVFQLRLTSNFIIKESKKIPRLPRQKLFQTYGRKMTTILLRLNPDKSTHTRIKKSGNLRIHESRLARDNHEIN